MQAYLLYYMNIEAVWICTNLTIGTEETIFELLNLEQKIDPLSMVTWCNHHKNKGVHPASNSPLILVLKKYLNSNNMTLVDLSLQVIGNMCGDSKPLSHLVLDCTNVIDVVHGVICNSEQLKSYRV